MLLRKFTLDDVDRLAKLLNDEEVSRWTATIPFPYSRQDAIDCLNNILTQDLRNPYAVVMHDEIVACVSWWPDDAQNIEVGYWVGRDYWGRGIAARALSLLLALPELPRNKPIVAKVMSGNEASGRVLLKNGFQFTGECQFYRMGKPVTGNTFVLKKQS